MRFFRGTGCSHCNNTGYRGRIGVFEFLEIDNILADALRSGNPLEFGRLVKKKENFRTLSQCALDYAFQGTTTLEEVFRVSEQLAEETLQHIDQEEG
jgi:MSHA biogenesis protein MshE